MFYGVRGLICRPLGFNGMCYAFCRYQVFIIRGFYVVIREIFTSDVECLSECKSFKEAWDFSKRKYKDESSSVVEDRSIGYKVGTSWYFALIASNSEVVSTRSTY